MLRMPTLHVTSVFVLLSALPVVADEPAAGSERVELTRDGTSAWRLWLVADAGQAERFAAAELRKYVARMSGAQIIEAGSGESGPVIRLQVVPSLAELGRYDAYRLSISAGEIRIEGANPRGVLYGVYDLLERIGCRWFYPAQDPADPEVVPTKKTLLLETGTWVQSSPMRYRICNGSGWFFKMNAAEAVAQADWAAKARYNAVGWQCETDRPLIDQYADLKKGGVLDELARRGLMLHGPAHSFNLLLPDQQYMAEHPDWFGMRDGKRVPQNFFGAQFCWSNAAARKQFTDNVEAFVKAAPHIQILAIVPFDGGKACECPPCRRMGASNALMQLMREVIERLSVSAPGVEVETVGGYGPMEEPPAGIEPHPRQRIVWAHWGRYYDTGYGDPRYGRRANLEAWHKAARGGLTVCQYYTDNFAEPWVLPPFAVALAADRQYFLDNQINSVYLLMYPRGYWWNHGLNGYLAGKCFYDTSLDPFAVLRDYALQYFGPAAGPLLEEYYRAWARDVDLAYRVRGDSQDVHRATLAEQRLRLIDPAVKAVRGDPVRAHRVSKVEKLHALAEALTGMHRRQQEIRKLRGSGQFEAAQQRLAAARPYTDEVLARFYKLADLNEGLIDRNEVGGFIKMAVKNWLDDEAKALAAKKID